MRLLIKYRFTIFQFLLFGILFLPPYLYLFKVPLLKFFGVLMLAIYLITSLKKSDVLSLNCILYSSLLVTYIISAMFSDAYDNVLVRSILNSLSYLGVFLFSKAFYDAFDDAFILLLRIMWISFLLSYLVVLTELFIGVQWTIYIPSYLGVELEGWSFISLDKERGGDVRYQGLTSHPLIFAVLSNISFIYLIANKNYSTLKIVATIGSLLLCVHAAYLSGSRAGIAIILILPFLHLLVKSSSTKNLIYISFLFSTLAVLLLSDFSSLDFIQDFFTGGNNTQIENSNGARLSQIEDAFSVLSMNSFIIGYGFESAIHYMRYGTIDNYWLSVFVESGLIGLGLFMVLFINTLKNTFNGQSNLNRYKKLFVIVIAGFSLILSLYLMNILLAIMFAFCKTRVIKFK
jgi:hypothetical protein